MRFISTQDLKDNMVLGKTIYGLKGETLLCSGARLNATMIRRIVSLGFKALYIEDSISRGIVVNDVIDTRLRDEATRKIKEFFNSPNIFGKNNISELTHEITRVIERIIAQVVSNRDMMIEMVDLKSFEDYTFQHSVNVCVLATVIGTAMNFKKKEILDLSTAALFHDIGKMFLSKEILTKPGKLTDREMNEMKSHPKLGYDYVSKIFFMTEDTVNAILMHHEKCNGKGYPLGKKKDEIPLFAKIIAICDVYDALTSVRSYNKASLPSDAFKYIMETIDLHFDAEVTSVFLKKVAPFPNGISVKLNTGEKGLVVKNSPTSPFRPTIKLFTNHEPVIDLSENQNFSISINSVL